MDNTTKTQIPVSPPQKEQEFVGGAGYIERVERQPEVPPEAVQAGVTPVTGPVLSEEAKKAGLETAKEEITPSLVPEGIVTLPLTEKQAHQVLKIHKNIAEAIVWLANFILRQFKILKVKRGES